MKEIDRAVLEISPFEVSTRQSGLVISAQSLNFSFPTLGSAAPGGGNETGTDRGCLSTAVALVLGVAAPKRRQFLKAETLDYHILAAE